MVHFSSFHSFFSVTVTKCADGRQQHFHAIPPRSCLQGGEEGGTPQVLIWRPLFLSLFLLFRQMFVFFLLLFRLFGFC